MAKAKQKFDLKLPAGHKNVLLHSCCAPCSCAVMDNLLEANIEYSVFFYNPNIHPRKEYEIRKEENKNFAAKHNIPFYDADYDKENWFERVKGMEHLPERGIRCTVCFDMRLERTALHAAEHGFSLFTSALAASRWKDLNVVNDSGVRAAARYDNLSYWTQNWRKYGNQPKMLEIAKENNMYQQEYCGCAFSLRDANQWRAENNREKIKIGIKYYGDQSESLSNDS